MPAWAMRSGARPDRVVPARAKLPSRAGTKPISVLQSVDLPMPFRPMTATDSRPIANETWSSTCELPYPAQRSCTASSGAAGVASAMDAGRSEGHLVHGGVAADVRRGAGGDYDPVGHHHHPL